VFIDFSGGEEHHTLGSSKFCILFGGCSVAEAMAWGLPCTDSNTELHCHIKSIHSVCQFFETEIEATALDVVYRPIISAPGTVIWEDQELKVRLNYTVRHGLSKNKKNEKN
jgi:hypothetical protein